MEEDDSMELDDTVADAQIIVRDQTGEKLVEKADETGMDAAAIMEIDDDPDVIAGPSTQAEETKSADPPMKTTSKPEEQMTRSLSEPGTGSKANSDIMEIDDDPDVIVGPSTQAEETKSAKDPPMKTTLKPKEQMTRSRSEPGTGSKVKSCQVSRPESTKDSSDEVVILDDDDDDEEIEETTAKLPPKKEVRSSISSEDDSKVEIVEEIIDLVKSGNSKCINYACKDGKELMLAPNMCLSYYRVKNIGKGKKEVCKECFDIAIGEYDMLATKLKAGEVLCEVDIPIRNDTVEIEDSDEDDDDSDGQFEEFSEENMAFIQKHFDEVLLDCLQKLNVSAQAGKEINCLRNNCSSIKSSLTEMKSHLKETRKTLDNVQISLYNQFRTETISAGTVMIVDDPTVNIPNRSAHHVSKSKYPTRMGKRVSYSDLHRMGHQTLKNPSTTPKTQSKTLPPPPVPAAGLRPPTPLPDAPKDLPQKGIPEKPQMVVEEIYFISRENGSGSWVRARFKAMVAAPGTEGTTDGISNENMLYQMMELKQLKERVVDRKNIASMKPSNVRLEMGTRVIAVFKEITPTGDVRKVRIEPYYPGIVAEPPVPHNRFRYLIFFDIGYSQYVSHQNVHMVFEASKNVWEDMHVTSRSFIKKYLESCDRPMVKLSKSQTVRAEYNGRWYMCTVMNVDCSLVLIFFDSLNRMEWIYRGSTRLSPMFKEEQNATKRHTGVRTSNRKFGSESATIVQYTKSTDFEKTADNVGNAKEGTAQEMEVESESAQATSASVSSNQPSSMTRSVAKKTTGRPEPPQITRSHPGNCVPFLPPVNSNEITVSEPTSKIMYFTPRDQIITQRLFRPHTCSSACKDYVRHNLSKLRGHNPLSKPLLCGWARLTTKLKGKKEIMYKAPCSRMLRNIQEVHKYLMDTNSDMTVDLFDFNHNVRCLAEFNVECQPDPRDLSKGQEQVPVPVINGISTQMLDFCNYETKRVPTEGVPLNLDPEFLTGCDCEDDCSDKSACSCWQLTLEGRKYMGKNVKIDSIGYIYRRLHEQVLTGIYECNSRCKCASTCLNRVVQNPMSVKMQVFRTHNRGWGIRCVNDVPQGTFICIYAGTIHTEQMANEDGQTYGDEYFAELDYIENCQKHKEDYEADALEPDSPSRSRSTSPEEMDEEPEKAESGRGRWRRKKWPDDNDFVPACPVSSGANDRDNAMRLRRRSDVGEKSDDSSGVKNDKDKKIVIKKEKKEPSDDVDGVTREIETVTISDDEDDPKEVLSFNPRSGSDLDDTKPSAPSIRGFFGEEEPYVMDTKNAGNIGRFLNHSCSPNVFVQNVFVDTHDLRFPWVAFFSSQLIRAGTELTWNYNYDIGSVPGRVLYCHCGSLECKGRLL